MQTLVVHRVALPLLLVLAGACACGGGADHGQPMGPPSSLSVLEQQKERIQVFLARGVIPIIDLESTLTEERMQCDFPAALQLMDELGIAQIAFEGQQAPQQDPPLSGYCWSYHVNELNHNYPAHFFLTANGGNSKNWSNQKHDASSYIVALENAIRQGRYRLMGELEFRHYLSAAQCRDNRTERDVSVPIDSANGHRVFKLSQDTGVPFVIHYEPEDALIAALENMLDTYPRAKVIWAHFGQLRKPALMTQFDPVLVERLLRDHPNLYFELSTGAPNRYYYCSGGSYDPDFGILDTAIWQDDGGGGQLATLKSDYRDVMEKFSDRFVSGADYGGNRAPFEDHFTKRINNIGLILRELSPAAKHNIRYKNAWRLLTGENWD